MGIGVSLLLIAIGAILKWAVTATVAGLSISTVGWILMVVGILGLLLSLVMFAPWGPRHVEGRTVRYDRYEDEDRP